MDIKNGYLELLRRCLTRSLFLGRRQLIDRVRGADWPDDAETMIGDIRLENIRHCLATVIKEQIPGDFIECGVWRGGACIYAKAVIESLASQMKVFVADSFCGFPAPTNPIDMSATFLHEPKLKVSRKTVEENFLLYRLLDERVQFVEGYFRETVPLLAHETFSVLRIDCDLYEPTTLILEQLYPRLSVGGFVIIDDYAAIDTSAMAVENFRRSNHIMEVLEPIGTTCACYWRKCSQ